MTPTVLLGTPIWELTPQTTNTLLVRQRRADQQIIYLCLDEFTWHRHGCSFCCSAVPCPQSGEWGSAPLGCSTRGSERSALWCHILWHTCKTKDCARYVCILKYFLGQKWKCIHFQTIQDVDKFVFSLTHIWWNLALNHFLQWMGAVRINLNSRY